MGFFGLILKAIKERIVLLHPFAWSISPGDTGPLDSYYAEGAFLETAAPCV